jgi:DNA-binding LacI/PurR family transcriptional regulator
MRTDIFVDIKLNQNAPIPLYRQLELAISGMIKDGQLRPGDRLPDGDVFASDLNISSKTVIKAMQSLVEKKLVVRRRKAGTFVADHSGSVPSVGFFYLHEAEDFMLKVAECIQRCCARRNYDLKAVSFDEDYYNHANLLSEFRRRGLDGAIVVPLSFESCRKSLEEVERAGFPVVRFGNPFFQGELRSPIIRGNEAKKTSDAINYLWNLGHRKIGLVNAAEGSDVERQYLKHFAKNGGFEDRWLMQVPFTGHIRRWPESGLQGMCLEYLKRNPELTAVVVEHAATCLEIMSKAQDMGRAVPADLSIISLMDVPGLDITAPPLTAMMQSSALKAEQACDELFSIMENGLPERDRLVEVDYLLVERSSTAPVSADR